MAAVMFLGILEGTVIATALPYMARDFRVDPIDMGKAITAYLIVSAMFLPLSSWVAERFGTRRVLIIAILGFGLASLLCAVSGSLEAFIAARALQAFFASLMVPVGNLVLLRVTPKDQLVQMMAISTTPALIAPVIGPPLGGFITSLAGWPFIFLINLPLAIVGAVLVWRLVPNLYARERLPFDLKGFALVALALAGLVYALDVLAAHPADWIWPAAIAALSLAFCWAALRHLRRVRAPIIPLVALRHPTFRSLAFGAGFLMRLPFMGQALLLPLYFQIGFGLSPVATGLLLLAQNLGDLVLKPFVSRVLRAIGFRPALVSGTITMMVTIGGCALLEPTMPFALLCAALFLTGMARSIAFTAMVSLTFADVTEDELAGASVLNNVANALSAAVGISLAALIINALAGSGGGAGSLDDYRAAILGLAAIGALAIPLYALLPREAGEQLRGRPLRPLELS